MVHRIGIDTGGTFTDIVLVDDETGEVQTVKIASTPSDPGLAVLDGLRRLDVAPQSIVSIVLGTTITTNAVLQRNGARVLYITTEGFEDIPQLQRADKPDPYDLQWEKPRPLVSRRDSLGVAERVRSDGSVARALEPAELTRVGDRVADWLAAVKPEGAGEADHAIAVNFLFSFANPAHERLLSGYLEDRFPGLAISLSSEVSPLWREYERASTTILDAYTRPLLKRFLSGLERRLKAEGYHAHLAMMKSNGGQMLASASADRPIHLLLSGLRRRRDRRPRLWRCHGTAKCHHLRHGRHQHRRRADPRRRPAVHHRYQLEFGRPVPIAPMLDVITIGAGGGSIAWIDKGGLLKVGPAAPARIPGRPLRARRHRADRHRRQCRARAARIALAPRRRHGA